MSNCDRKEKNTKKKVNANNIGTQKFKNVRSFFNLLGDNLDLNKIVNVEYRATAKFIDFKHGLVNCRLKIKKYI